MQVVQDRSVGTKSIRSADAFNFGVPPPSTLAIYLPHATGWLLQPQASYVHCGPRETGRGRDGHASIFHVTQQLHILLSLIHTALPNTEMSGVFIWFSNDPAHTRGFILEKHRRIHVWWYLWLLPKQRKGKNARNYFTYSSITCQAKEHLQNPCLCVRLYFKYSVNARASHLTRINSLKQGHK